MRNLKIHYSLQFGKDSSCYLNTLFFERKKDAKTEYDKIDGFARISRLTNSPYSLKVLMEKGATV